MRWGTTETTEHVMAEQIADALGALVGRLALEHHRDPDAVLRVLIRVVATLATLRAGEITARARAYGVR